MPETLGSLGRRAEAAFIAAACGDALGWPAESRGGRVGGTRSLKPELRFHTWQRRTGGRFAAHVRNIPAGTYSDDTQLLIAVSRSLTCGPEWWHHWTQAELPLWLTYEQGGGGATKRAAAAWARGLAPWSSPLRDIDQRRYFEAGGNGVVMRVLPHAIAGIDRPFDAVAENVIADGIATHGHPRALVGALAQAYMLWRALTWHGRLDYGVLPAAAVDDVNTWAQWPGVSGIEPDWEDRASHHLRGDFRRLWNHTVEEMLGLLLTARDALDRGSLALDTRVLTDLGAIGPENGSGTRTTAAAAYLASRYAAQPSAGLLAAAFAIGSDTDTVACCTGALVGALTGPDWLGGIAAELQDVDFLAACAVRSGRILPAQVALPFRAGIKREFFAELAQAGPGQSIEMPVLGQAEVLGYEEPETKGPTGIQIWWVRTRAGQTLAVSKTSKAEGGGRPTAAPAEAALREAPPLPASEAGARLFHALRVSELGRSIEFYRRLLEKDPDRATDTHALFSPSLLLETAPERTHTRPSEASRVCILVSSTGLMRRFKRLSDDGGQVSEIREPPGWREFFATDPDGHVVEVRSRAE